MRWFDYRDTTIFFIPFLGAAATGRKDKPTLGEEMIILLAGPMPGLFLGALLGFIPEVRSSDLGRTAILMLVDQPQAATPVEGDAGNADYALSNPSS